MTTATSARLAGTPAPRLGTLDGKRIGFVSTGKRNCDALLDEIGLLLDERFDLAALRSWSKASVYKFSPPQRLNEIKDSCDAVVAGLGDCGHGSACTLHDVYWLEEQSIPVAYIDTPGRTHKVWREGDIFVMEYFTLKYVVPEVVDGDPDRQRAKIRKQVERQGIYRALRLAGAKPGDRVRLLDTEFTLAELPGPPKQWAPNSEGMPDYKYVVTPRIGRLDADGVRERARELLPRVVQHLMVDKTGSGP